MVRRPTLFQHFHEHSHLCFAPLARVLSGRRRFDGKFKLRFSRVPIHKTKSSIVRCYLTVPWVPQPTYEDLVNGVDR